MGRSKGSVGQKALERLCGGSGAGLWNRGGGGPSARAGQTRAGPASAGGMVSVGDRTEPAFSKPAEPDQRGCARTARCSLWASLDRLHCKTRAKLHQLRRCYGRAPQDSQGSTAALHPAATDRFGTSGSSDPARPACRRTREALSPVASRSSTRRCPRPTGTAAHRDRPRSGRAPDSSAMQRPRPDRLDGSNPNSRSARRDERATG